MQPSATKCKQNLWHVRLSPVEMLFNIIVKAVLQPSVKAVAQAFQFTQRPQYMICVKNIKQIKKN